MRLNSMAKFYENSRFLVVSRVICVGVMLLLFSTVFAQNETSEINVSASSSNASKTLSNYNKINHPCLCQEYRCDAKEEPFRCLSKTMVCDGSLDCPSGDDEKGCNSRKFSNECNPKKEFRCKFWGECIALNKVCDGVIDCRGAVDEASDFCKWVHS